MNSRFSGHEQLMMFYLLPEEVVARTVHNNSLVKKGPFVPLDCGAIPETLIESELFGYVKGAFTGALSDKQGHFELADGGTLFLDEIANLPYTAQQKLLRAIQEKNILKLGASSARPVDVRIIAATNRPLERFVEERTFRNDLYYRLKEVTVKVPPLRRRTEDIIYLGQRFLQEAQVQLGKQSRGFSRQALEMMLGYTWPGNVRELRNVVRQAILLCDENSWVGPEHLMLSEAYMPSLPPCAPEKERVQNQPGPTPASPPASDDGMSTRSLAERVKEATADLEREILLEALRATRGNKLKAARLLLIDYKTMLRKLKLYNISL